MKILHICTGWPLSYKGGITNYVRSLAETQNRAGCEVSVLGAPDTEDYAFNYIPYTSSIIPFTYSPLVDKAALKTIETILHRDNYDIIHIHALEYIDWDLYSVLKDYKYVVSLHDYCFICPRIYMYPGDGSVCDRYDAEKCSKCISYLDRYRLPGRMVNAVNRLFGTSLRTPHIKQNITTTRYTKSMELLNNADYILPVSYKVEEIYKKSGVTANSKVLHIGNVSADKYTEDFEYNAAPHTIKIVFLGRLTAYKGADLFLRIADDLKNVDTIEFHFLGSAGNYSKQLEDAGIVNHGPYNPADLSSLLMGYDIGMVLSIWHDNGPQVVMELLNNHVPVIGTRMGGIPDFLNTENGYVFDPYSEEEIHAVEGFIKDLTPQKIYKMKASIRRTTTTDEHNRAVMELYQEVLNNKNQG